MSSSRVAPFIELMRVSNPVGTIMTFFPMLIGSLFAACSHATLRISPERILATNAVFLVSAFLLHASGCSWNDIIDADLDQLVSRTKNRPIPRGAISRKAASLFTAAEVSIWLGTLSLISSRVVWWALPLVIFVGLYPYAKRFTRYPSIVLGCVLSYGLFMGSVSVGLDPIDLYLQGSLSTFMAMVCILMAYVFQVTSADMIYAHQDLKDDLKAGIRSLAVTFQGRAKTALSGFTLLQFVLLTYAGQIMHFSGVYTAITCAGTAAANTWMIWSVNLESVEDCWRWFQYGSLLIGTTLSAGLLMEYIKDF